MQFNWGKINYPIPYSGTEQLWIAEALRSHSVYVFMAFAFVFAQLSISRWHHHKMSKQNRIPNNQRVGKHVDKV